MKPEPQLSWSVRPLPVVPTARRAQILALETTAHRHEALLGELGFADVVEMGGEARSGPSAGAARVVAWNAERCKDVEASARMLAATGAELFLLSELDVGMARSAQRHTPRELASALGCAYCFGVEFLELGLGDARERETHAGATNRAGYHGAAILGRRPLRRPALLRLEPQGTWFDGARGERRVGGRIALVAEVELGGATLTLASVHLESHAGPSLRADQMRQLLGTLEVRARSGPVLVGGDVNSHSLGPEHRDDRVLRAALAEDPERMVRPVPHEPLFAAARRSGFDFQACNRPEVSTERRTWPAPSARGLLKLDWFFARGLSCQDPEVVEAVHPGTGAALSDHEAIAVTVVAPDASSPR